MTKLFMTVIVVSAVLSGVGCGRDEVPSVPNDAVVNVGPEHAPLSPGESRGISDQAIRQFVQEADKRLEDHVIQIAGLKFLGDAYFDPGLIVKLEDKLAEGQKNLRQIQLADMPNAKVIKGRLITLLGQMDQLYELAMAETVRKQPDIDDPDSTEDDQDALDSQDEFNLSDQDAEDAEDDDELDDLEPGEEDEQDGSFGDSLDQLQEGKSFGDEDQLDEGELAEDAW